ncbi:MAG: acetate uptake transporter [Acidimicrobiales bacterium]
MSTANSMTTTSGRQPYEHNGRSTEDAEYEWWREHSRVVISPTASPSAMGLFGFAAATLIVAGNLAGWYGNTHSAIYFAPFCLAFGGIGQFLAGMWSYKARDTIATVVHTMWGSFWIAFGILWLMIGSKALALPPGAPDHVVSLGMWFVMLALLTGICALAAMAKSIGVFSVLGLLTAGSALLAGGYIGGSHTTLVAGGWVLVASAGAAVYTGAALIFADSYGRTILPLGKFSVKHNVPGRIIAHPIQYEGGMPGVRVGQ